MLLAASSYNISVDTSVNFIVSGGIGASGNPDAIMLWSTTGSSWTAGTGFPTSDVYKTPSYYFALGSDDFNTSGVYSAHGA